MPSSSRVSFILPGHEQDDTDVPAGIGARSASARSNDFRTETYTSQLVMERPSLVLAFRRCLFSAQI